MRCVQVALISVVGVAVVFYSISSRDCRHSTDPNRLHEEHRGFVLFIHCTAATPLLPRVFDALEYN
ncbi:hypothetical protein BDV98DRAFT_559218 [Pterulicium gracile]|uniref:Uncharacterized protein n=1 Tax=Pterulicium gracile TaxID=1884261 RepID=A0A5C3QWN4_9AGAR|nr:hypothetical protein BDV98DRAFT_559218 [Pterula gracilis]